MYEDEIKRGSILNINLDSVHVEETKGEKEERVGESNYILA